MVQEKNMRLFGSSYTALIGSRNMALREAIGCKTTVYDEKNVTQDILGESTPLESDEEGEQGHI